AEVFWLEASVYRIRQALEGKPHRGPLPVEQMEYLAHLVEERKQNRETAGTGAPYIIDRLRELSRILEPDQEIAPYRHMVPFMNELERTLGELPDVLDRNEVAARIHGLLQRVPRGDDGPAVRA